MIMERIPVDSVRVRDRLRALAPEKVDGLVASLGEVGLRTPIHVRVLDRLEEGGRVFEGVPILVAGRHRLEAARRLGWEEIDAYVLDGDERDARLWEIAENLHRAELTVQERADHIAEWVRLTGEKVRQVDAPMGGKQPREAGQRAASRELGVPEAEVRRAVKIAGIEPEAKAAAAADPKLADNQAALLRVASEPSAERQLARIRAEQEAAEAHKANRQTDRVLALTEAEQFAEWIMGSSSLDELPKIIAWLEGTKPRDVAAALRRQAA